MKIAIVGAGITGLTLGYYLSKAGMRVTIFEKDNFTGGFLSGFKLGNWHLERFYHHIFRNDRAILQLTDDLGLPNIWIWKNCGAPIYFQGKIYPFSSAFDLMNFSPISITDRFRTGIVSLFLKTIKDYHYFEGKKAASWLLRHMGQQSWQIIWKPLMKKKFGYNYKDISMTWMWARINRRSRYLGYPMGGFQIIIDRLVDEIKRKNGGIILNRCIDNITELKSFNKIIFTGASPLFLKTAPQLPFDYKRKLEKTKYLGTVTVLLLLKKPITDWVYWLNINDLNIPFLALIQQSNLINNKHYNDLHPVYLSIYIEKDSNCYKISNTQILKIWLKKIKKINPDFTQSWIKKWYLFKELYAQPVFTTNNKNIPDFKTPLKNVFLVNMSQIYPWDRGINDAVELVNKFIDNKMS